MPPMNVEVPRRTSSKVTAFVPCRCTIPNYKSDNTGSHGARSACPLMRSLTHPAHPLHYYKVISVFLLVFNIVVLSVYFGIHCTPMLGTMVDYPNARKFIGITSSIEIIAGILLIVGLASSLTVLSMVSKSSRGQGGVP